LLKSVGRVCVAQARYRTRSGNRRPPTDGRERQTSRTRFRSWRDSSLSATSPVSCSVATYREAVTRLQRQSSHAQSRVVLTDWRAPERRQGRLRAGARAGSTRTRSGQISARERPVREARGGRDEDGTGRRRTEPEEKARYDSSSRWSKSVSRLGLRREHAWIGTRDFPLAPAP